MRRAQGRGDPAKKTEKEPEREEEARARPLKTSWEAPHCDLGKSGFWRAVKTECLIRGAPGGMGQEQGTVSRDSLSSFVLNGGTETK